MNINRFLTPNDVITKLASIYEFIGKNDAFESAVQMDYARIVSQTVERDAYFLSKILQLDISDARLRLVIMKDSSPRTKDETTLYNIKEVLSAFQLKHKETSLDSSELLNIINYVYASQQIKFDYLPIDKKEIHKQNGVRSKRDVLDDITQEVQTIITHQQLETIILYLHYFIDFYNLAPFTEQNESAAHLLLYLLLLKAKVYAFKYVSYFELLYKHYDTYIDELKSASFNWKEGLSQTLEFVRLMLGLVNSAYQRTSEIINDYADDQNLNKADNVENTILNISGTFTKEEIRLIHPYVSESTINRALTKLRDENKIKPLGKGRSAKWVTIKQQ